MAALPKMGHQISNLHNFGTTATHKSQNGNQPRGFGPLVTLGAGNWKVQMGAQGVGATLKLLKADGTVLSAGNGGRLTFATPTSVQFMVSAPNLDALTGSGGTIVEDQDPALYRGIGTTS
jgi:hypothetical protein